MALTDESGMNTTMLVSPANGMSNGFGNGFGGDGWWIILLLLFACGGWGNGFGGNGNGFVPYAMNTNNDVQRGFDQSAIMGGINGINAGINGIQNSLCNGFAGVNQTVSNGFAQAEIAENSRQMANMNQMFNLQSQFANCCCENRLGIANLNSTILSENCADRAALAEGVRDIITNQSNNTQRILDQMCNDKIDAKNEKIADLERQLTMANLNASQIAQTAQIQRGQTAEVDALYQRLRDCPVPTMPVYGMTPIFTCPQNQNSCGCGCGM